MHNGKLHLAIPPGHVDARCLICPGKPEVIIPEGTLRCPNGDHDVEPTSLPRMPRPEPVNGMPPLPAELLPAPTVVRLQGERKLMSVQPATPPTPEPAAKELEPVVLPDAALGWHADTVALHAQLVADEARLAEQLKRTRQTRKLLDVVLGRVTAPELPPDVIQDIVPEMASQPGTASPLSEGVVPAEPMTAPSTGPFRCLNPECGTPDARHAAKGRCSRCYTYWKSHGAERPRDLPQRGGIYTHG